MNCSADKFVEFNSKDKEGNVITPVTNVLEFTHSNGNKKYETVLTADQATEYALEKVFPDWRPEEIAAQSVYVEGEELIGNIYLVDGVIYAGELPAGNGIKVRKANARGGFGAEVVTNHVTSGIDEIDIDMENAPVEYFNLQGMRIHNPQNGQIVICRQGSKSLKIIF